MTDQPEQPPDQAADEGAPVPDAAPAPAPAEDPAGRAAALERELAKIRADAVAGAKVLLRVLAPHSAFTHAGVTVGTEPTPVPARLAPAITEAAADAGVELRQEG